MRTLVFFLLLLCALPALARDYYFQQAHSSDQNACTKDKPCTSLAKVAQLSLRPGDGVYFRRGDRFLDTAESGLVIVQGGGTQAQPIIIGAYDTGPRPIWSRSGNGFAILLRSSAWVQIQDLDLQGYQFSLGLFGAEDITVRNVAARRPQNACFQLKEDTRNANRPTARVLFDTVEADGCGAVASQQGEGFYIGDNGGGKTRDITILNSYIHDTAFECIEIKEGTRASLTIRHTTLRNCHARNQDPTNAPTGNSGVGLVAADADQGDSDVTFEYNWIDGVQGTWAKTGHGLRFVQQGILAQHNLVTGVSRTGIVLETGSGTTYPKTILYNTIVGSGAACMAIEASARATEANNLCWANGSGNAAADPLFVDMAHQNYNLRPGSPAYQTASPAGMSVGALQPFAWTKAVMQPDHKSVLLTAAVHEDFTPLSVVTPAQFELSCATTPSQHGIAATMSGEMDTMIVFPTATLPAEACTLTAALGAAQDSAQLGGTLAPQTPLNSWSMPVSALPVTPTEGTEPPTPPTWPGEIAITLPDGRQIVLSGCRVEAVDSKYVLTCDISATP